MVAQTRRDGGHEDGGGAETRIHRERLRCRRSPRVNSDE